jgi:hypothetical protein
MGQPLYDRGRERSGPSEPARAEGFASLPAEMQGHLRAELAATKEPGWLERYRAEVEERRKMGPGVAHKR